MGDSFNKKEREKRKQKRKKDKEARKEDRKSDEKSTDEFMYLDEDGNLTSEPPDPTKKKKEIKVEDIQLGAASAGQSSASKFNREGVVKFFNDEKGYGFIEDSEGGESFFVHIDSVDGDIKERDKVSFEVGKGPKGPIALAVKKLS